MPIALNHSAVDAQAGALWAAQPALELAYFDYGAFFEARLLEEIERTASLAAIEGRLAEHHAQQRKDAAGRLALIRRPLCAEPQERIVEVIGKRICCWLYGRVGDSDKDGEFCETAIVRVIQANPNAQCLVLRVASCGGFIDTLDRIVSAIRTFKGRTVSIIDAATSSAGAHLALICDRVVMRAGSTLMLHRTHRAAQGNCVEHRAVAQELETTDNRLDAELFLARPKADHAAIRSAIDSAQYLTAQQALSMGLVDAITRPLPILQGAKVCA